MMKNTFLVIVLAGIVLLACNKKIETPAPYPPIILTADQTAACYVNDSITNSNVLTVAQYDSASQSLNLGFRALNEGSRKGCVVNITTVDSLKKFVLNKPLRVTMTYKRLLANGKIDESEEWNLNCLSRDGTPEKYATMTITAVDSVANKLALSGTFSGSLCAKESNAWEIIIRGGVFHKIYKNN